MKGIIIFLLITCNNFVKCEDILVETNYGTVKGYEEYSNRGNSFYAFLEIPYAQPPVGNLRFKSPVRVEPWDGVFEATTNKKACYQQTAASELVVETEDCLYLNVYTQPDFNADSSLPVMVYIYGGGFVGGYATFNANGPHYLMEKDVIVVTISYRVGPFGFLATGDTVIPGNYGLKDQNLALQWIQENIKYFGGDPAKVTIFGQSAGGASVTFHLMSKKSQGLFRAGISQSGSILCPWAYQRYHKTFAYNLAKFLNESFPMDASSEELLEFLQGVSADDIKRAHASFTENLSNVQILQGFWFTPAIEPEHEEAFITENMYDAIALGHMNTVPLLIGICSEEQIYWASDINNFKLTMQVYDQNVSLLVNNNMHLTNEKDLESAGEDIRKIYADDGVLAENLGSSVGYFSDMGFNRPIIHHAWLQSQFSDVYFYQFSYHGELGHNNIYVEGAERVGHSEDCSYLWVYNNQSDLDNYPEMDIIISNAYRNFFTNFAKYLQPIPCEDLGTDLWPPVKQDFFAYMNIKTYMRTVTNPKEFTYSKWVGLYETKAVKPFDTF